jgi:hypothetical protein
MADMSAEGSGEAIVSFARRVWRGARWVLLVILLLFIALVIYRIPAVEQNQKTQQVVAQIHAQKLTMDDVNGKHLPPSPDSAQADATVAGIDANGNGIRDDVELAIFKKYPTSTLAVAKIRAAELQYAMELQTMITEVFNSDTWKAAAIEEDRGYQCIAGTYSRADLTLFNQVTGARTKEVEDLEFNTQLRSAAEKQAFSFTTSYGLPDSDFCDTNVVSQLN